MKQRYHYNVADSRLHQHIEKGNQDGLYISSVASSANFWALIMDAGTGFCSQVYELSQMFLHKEWITEQWEKNYYITAIAGATNGSSLVVMSKGLLIIFSVLNTTLIRSAFFCGKGTITVKQELSRTYCAPKLCALHIWLSVASVVIIYAIFRWGVLLWKF